MVLLDLGGLIIINNASKKSGLKSKRSDIIKRNKLENIKRKCLSALRAFLVTLSNNLCKLDSQILGILLVNVNYALRRRDVSILGKLNQ